MRHEHGGDAEFAQQAAQLDLHGLAQLAVEGGEGLVEQQQLGLYGERAGHRYALLLAARQARTERSAKSVRWTSDEETPHRRADLASGMLSRLQAERDVLGDGQVREERVVLEDDADVAPVRRPGDPISSPSSRMVPRSAASRPATMRSKVVLPHPEGPSSDMNSPAAT